VIFILLLPRRRLSKRQQKNSAASLNARNVQTTRRRKVNNLHPLVLWVRDARSHKRNYPITSMVFLATALQMTQELHNQHRNIWNGLIADHRWYLTQIIRWVDWKCCGQVLGQWLKLQVSPRRFLNSSFSDTTFGFCSHTAYELPAAQSVVVARCCQSHFQWKGHCGGRVSWYNCTSRQHWSTLAVGHCFDRLRPANKHTTSIYSSECVFERRIQMSVLQRSLPHSRFVAGSCGTKV
jgi:hypothetical protein